MNIINDKDMVEFLRDARDGVWPDELFDLGFHGVDTLRGIIYTDQKLLDDAPPRTDRVGNYRGEYYKVVRIAREFSQATTHHWWQDHRWFIFTGVENTKKNKKNLYKKHKRNMRMIAWQLEQNLRGTAAALMEAQWRLGKHENQITGLNITKDDDLEIAIRFAFSAKDKLEKAGTDIYRAIKKLEVQDDD